jgi:methyl-accepting chemotaxis protein
LIDTQGNVVFTVSRESDLGANLKTGKLNDSGLAKAFREGSSRRTLVDFSWYAPSNEAAAFLAAPLKDENGKLVGVAAFQVALTAINKIMQERTGLGQSGETYLLGPDKRMRSDSFLDPQNRSVKASFAGNIKDNGVDTEASRAALSGQTGEKVVIDYNGNPVLSAYTPVKVGNLQWALMAEIDESEAFAAVYTLEWIMGIVGVIGVIIIVFVALWVARSLRNPIAAAVDGLKLVAQGDFTLQLEQKYLKRGDEIGDMMRDLQGMADNLSTTVQEVMLATNSVADSTNEISQGNQDLSERTQQQASAIEETASAVEQMTSSVKHNAENSQNANVLASRTSTMAQEGGEVVKDTVAAMEAVTESSNKISEITNLVNEIAFQTNLLALNAAVEAARAGEAGRGFAVVAGEVRNLAGRSASAAKEIQALITDTVSKVEQGNELVAKSGGLLQEIIENVQNVAGTIGEISASSQEQAQGIDEINKAVAQMDDAVQQNAALVEEAASSSENMAAAAEELRSQMAQFKVRGQMGGSSQPKKTRPANPAAKKTASEPSAKKLEEPKDDFFDDGGLDGFEQF